MKTLMILAAFAIASTYAAPKSAPKAGGQGFSLHVVIGDKQSQFTVSGREVTLNITDEGGDQVSRTSLNDQEQRELADQLAQVSREGAAASPDCARRKITFTTAAGTRTACVGQDAELNELMNLLAALF